MRLENIYLRGWPEGRTNLLRVATTSCHINVFHPEHSAKQGTVLKGLEESSICSDHVRIQRFGESEVEAVVDAASCLQSYLKSLIPQSC